MSLYTDALRMVVPGRDDRLAYSASGRLVDEGPP